MKRVFKTAMDISAVDHIKALSSIQKWVDSSVSKTINFPESAKMEDIMDAYILAHKLGCKGLTVYRYKSIEGVYQLEERSRREVCPVCGEEIKSIESCIECPNCGWSACQL